LFAIAPIARGQGHIVFNNRITNALMAPVYGPEIGNPSIAKHGNTASAIPAGTQHYTGTPLSGSGYIAQLFGGPTNATVENLSALLPCATFRTGEEAGFVVAPPFTLPVTGVVEGQPAKIVMRVWENPGGVTNWNQVLARPELKRGESLAFISEPLGGIFVPPPNLTEFRSFNLMLPAAPAIPIQIISTSYETYGVFSLTFLGPTNSIYRVERTQDFTTWEILASNLFVPSVPWTYQDNGALSSPRFYRVSRP
jgi:hypothetical protein